MNLTHQIVFIDKLKDHVGDLIRLKSDLYWYDFQSWDRVRERICLLLYVDDNKTAPLNIDATTPVPYHAELIPAAIVLFLIDDRPRWVWISESHMEFIK